MHNDAKGAEDGQMKFLFLGGVLYLRKKKENLLFNKKVVQAWDQHHSTAPLVKPSIFLFACDGLDWVWTMAHGEKECCAG